MTKFISKVKLTKQGQVTLPLEARDDLNIETGSEIYWYEVGDNLVLSKKLVSLEDIKKLLKKEVK